MLPELVHALTQVKCVLIFDVVQVQPVTIFAELFTSKHQLLFAWWDSLLSRNESFNSTNSSRWTNTHYYLSPICTFDIDFDACPTK